MGEWGIRAYRSQVTDTEWREVISPDGVRCFVAGESKPEPHRASGPEEGIPAAVAETEDSRARERLRGLAPWRTKLIEAKPSNNSKLEQPMASESDKTT
jgi:hypothetical protein